MKKVKVCVIGLGYVGLTLAMHAVRQGYEVHGVEILDETFDTIVSGNTPFHEPGLDELLKLSLGKSFFVYKDIPLEESFDTFVVTVGTPLVQGQKIPNLSVLDNAVNSVAPFISEQTLLILRSTIPVGTTARVAENIATAGNLRSVNVGFCPERTAEGNALVELESLPQVISGNSTHALDLARRFFEPLTNQIIEAASLEEAELIKLFTNAYRDTVFAIANTFNRIAQVFDIDGMSAIEKANYKYDRCAIPKPGFVAGPCLEKDAYILSSNLPDGDLKNFLLCARATNETLEEKVADTVEKYLLKNNEAKILFSGLAFKGVPQTNDLRGSSGLNILRRLSKYHRNITVHDFMNDKLELHSRSGFTALEPDEIFDEPEIPYDYIIILNNHPRYAMSQMKQFVSNQIALGSVVVDAWNMMNLPDQLTLSNILVEEG